MAGPAGAPGVTLEQLESREGRELGVVRISLGLASNWEDVRSIMSFASKFADTREVAEMKKEWMAGKANEERGLMCS